MRVAICPSPPFWIGSPENTESVIRKERENTDSKSLEPGMALRAVNPLEKVSVGTFKKSSARIAWIRKVVVL